MTANISSASWRFPALQPASAEAAPLPSAAPAPEPEPVHSLTAQEPTGTPEPTGSPEEYGLPKDCGLQEKVRWEKQERFCAAYARFGTLTAAEKATGIHWSTRTYWLQENMYGFRDRLKAAQEEYTAYWESQMDARLESPTGNRGSDILMMFKLKALNPQKYRETITLQPSADTKELLDVFRKLGAASRAARSVDAEVKVLPAAES